MAASAVLNYYCHGMGAENQGDQLYPPQPAEIAPPPGTRLLASKVTLAPVFTRRSCSRRTPGAAPVFTSSGRIYEVPGWMLFHGRRPSGNIRVFNVLDVIRGLGLNLDSVGRSPPLVSTCCSSQAVPYLRPVPPRFLRRSVAFNPTLSGGYYGRSRASLCRIPAKAGLPFQCISTELYKQTEAPDRLSSPFHEFFRRLRFPE